MTWVLGDNLDLNWSQNSLSASLAASVVGTVATEILEMEYGTTGSMVQPPSIAGLDVMFPTATTGSLVLATSASVGALAFKNQDGLWMIVTASLAV